MKKLLLSGLGITLCLSLGRIIGFLRDIIVTNFFGKTYAADMAVLILMIQDLLLNFFLGSAFSLALMSEFLGKQEKIGSIVYAYHKLLTRIMVVTILLLMLNINFAINFLAPGLPYEYQIQLRPYLITSIFSIPFIVYAAITTTALNFLGFFVLPSLGTAIFNFIVCFFIVIGFFLSKENPFYYIASGVVLGAILRWIVQLKALPFKISFSAFSLPDLRFSRFTKKYLNVMLSTSSIFIIPIIARAFASKQGMGQISLFNFVSKLIDFPINLFSGVIVTILIPKLVKLENQWRIIMYSSIGLFIFFTFALLGTWCLADYIIGVLLAWGSFSASNLYEITKQLKIAACMFPAYGVAFFLVSALATTKYGTFYGILCLFLNILFYYFGKMYITNLYHLYIGLISIYSILGITGFILVLTQLKICTSRKNDI